MSKYETAVAAMTARRVTVASSHTEITMTAAEARKLGTGRAYIAHRLMGICRGYRALPHASDAAPKAVVTIAPPESDAERDALVAAVVEQLERTPGCGGSAYDPSCAAAWAEYRRVMAELRA